MAKLKKNQAPIVISLGGSLVAPDLVDIAFVKKFHRLIVSEVRKGKRFIIIVGGGKTSRRYQQAARGIVPLTAEDIDWIGIHASRLNAHLLRTVFRKQAYRKLITSKRDINPKIRKPIIIGAGFRPGSSTDLRAVELARAFGSSVVLNLSNIAWVYDKDPKKFPNARRIKQMTWKEFRKLVGNKWDPGANTPFDPVASKSAQRWKIRVVIAQGKDFNNVKKFLQGKRGRGTVIE